MFIVASGTNAPLYFGNRQVPGLPPPPERHNDVILEKIVWRRPLTTGQQRL